MEVYFMHIVNNRDVQLVQLKCNILQLHVLHTYFYLSSADEALSALHSINSVAGTSLNYLYYPVLLHYSTKYTYIICPLFSVK